MNGSRLERNVRELHAFLDNPCVTVAAMSFTTADRYSRITDWFPVIDRIEHGVVASVQKGKVDWTGSAPRDPTSRNQSLIGG